MIDNIRVSYDIFKSDLNERKFNKEYLKTDNETKEYYYEAFTDIGRIAFYPNTNKLIISGRYIKTITNSYTDNFDDIISTKEELDSFFYSINKQISEMLIGIEIDIRTFKPSRIDFCLNIHTPYVNEYIRLFNKCFIKTKNKNYKNFVFEMDKELNTSFYVKTTKQFEKRKNQNFTANFYNKKDQLLYRREKDVERFGRSSITADDIEEASDILRLEVQAHYEYLKRISEAFNIDFKTRQLVDYFDIDIVAEAIKRKLKFFFGEEDFYSYKAAKQILLDNKCRMYYKNMSIYTYIKKKNNNESVPNIRKFTKQLKQLGINPKCFIPKLYGIDYLKNPIKLIDEKIKEKRLDKLKYKEAV